MGKKKGPAADEAEVPAAEVPEVVDALEPESEEDGKDGEAGMLSKSQKKKQKQKQKATSEAAAEAAEAAFAPPARKAAGEKEAADESEEEADGAAADGASAKKKKKKKKKAGGGALVAFENTGRGPPKYISDEEWAVWVSGALEATNRDIVAKTPQEDLLKVPDAFNGYTYTGSLRPSFVTPQYMMPEGFLLPDYGEDLNGRSLCERNAPVDAPILEGKDLETMRQACRYGREVLDIAARYLREGVTGDEIDRVVYQACVDRKIYPSPLNYFRFPKSVCVSVNEVICHGIPDCRPIENGDIVNLDVSIYYNGFHSDLNETFLVGDCGEEAQRVVRTAYCALLAAAKLMRPGTLYRDLGNVIHAEAARNNCAVVTTYCGHGVGQLFHGPPKIPHYRKNKAVGLMKPGHVFTVEPMINIGSNGGDSTWPDNWTAVTKDGKRSSQFEHTFLVTETGVELLTSRYGTDPSFMPEYDAAMFQR